MTSSDEEVLTCDANAPHLHLFPEEERRLVRKLDKRILPIVCLLYLFAYLDRSNLGNARLQGLPRDVLGGDRTGVLFDWVNSFFYFSYISCQVPATVLSKLFPPRLWMGAAAIGWGLSSTLMSTAVSFPGLMVARFILGIFEACFGPTIPLYFSFFYTKEEMGFRLAQFLGFGAVAGACGGLIAYGVQHIHVSLASWRILFLVEGLPTVLLGITAMFALPDRPEVTKFLNDKERILALERRNRFSRGDIGATVNRRHIVAALRDWRIYIGGMIYFGMNCALASLGAFLPTIITTFGYTNARAQILTVPPYAVGAVVLMSVAYLSDKLQSRGLFMAAASCVGATGYMILLLVPSNHARYFATFCITSGTFTTIGITLAWYAHNLGSETKKATGLPMLMAIGHCGSILGSHLYPIADGPRYITGFAAGCALELLAAICAVVLSVGQNYIFRIRTTSSSLVYQISYRRENTRRDRLYGKPVQGEVDTHELADKAPAFRYIP